MFLNHVRQAVELSCEVGSQLPQDNTEEGEHIDVSRKGLEPTIPVHRQNMQLPELVV